MNYKSHQTAAMIFKMHNSVQFYRYKFISNIYWVTKVMGVAEFHEQNARLCERI